MTKLSLTDVKNFIKNREIDHLDFFIVDKKFQIYRTHKEEDLIGDLQECFYAPLLEWISEESIKIKGYDPSLSPDYVPLWNLKTEDIPNFKSVIDGIEADFESNDFFRDDLVGKINGYFIRISLTTADPNKTDTLYIFQNSRPKFIVEKSSGLALMFSEGGEFEKINKVNNVLIKRRSHLFLIEDDVFILDKGEFENMFDYWVKKKEISNEKIDLIIKDCPLEIIGSKTLPELIGDNKTISNKLQKMDIAGSIKLIADNFNLVAKLIDEANLKIGCDESAQKLQVSDKKEAVELIKILDDDFLISEWTKRRYDTHSKESMVKKSKK